MAHKLFLSLLIFFLSASNANAQFFFWRYREHATDCTSLTDGKDKDLCFEIDANTLYKCEPSAGDCDTAAEWKLSSGAGSGDITDVWGCSTGDCSSLTAAAGDSMDAGSADSIKPCKRGTALPGTCAEGDCFQDTDSGGIELYVCTAANTWTKALTSTDNIATATALAANGANCSAGNYPLGVDASGAVESCTADDDIPEAGDYSNLTGGAGVVNSPTGTIATASGEADFLASGALTCGASTQGKAQVHTTPLQYCDNTATPTLRYAAYGDSSGNANTGDSATSFFSAGQIERARGGLGADTSSFGAGIIGSDSGNNTIDIDTEAELETALSGIDVVVIATDDITSANLRTALSDESGTGAAVFAGGDVGAATAATPAADDNDTSVATTAYVQTELNASGGRSITCSLGTCDADAELYTRSITWHYPASPVDTDDDKSIWCNDTGKDFTVTKLKCESDQTVTMMLQVDDGTPADMDSVDLVCISTPDTDISLDGDNVVADGECVDVATTSVSGSPTWCSVTFTGTFND